MARDEWIERLFQVVNSQLSQFENKLIILGSEIKSLELKIEKVEEKTEEKFNKAEAARADARAVRQVIKQQVAINKEKIRVLEEESQKELSKTRKQIGILSVFFTISAALNHGVEKTMGWVDKILKFFLG